MKIFRDTKSLSDYIEKQSSSIGFVPTMGAIHQGHLSLIKKSKKDGNLTVCSIFVNPNQFNDKKDLEKYPRTEEKDVALLKSSNCDIVFIPTVEDIYPEPDNRKFDFGNLGKVMEAKHREGHFNGVAQVVTRLFDIVKPDIAYFGLKDFQQYSIIKKVVEDYNLKVKVVGCETIREKDGLAMSSRNMNLNEEERNAAKLIPEALQKAKILYNNGEEIETIKNGVETIFNNNSIYRFEYFEIAKAKDLTPITKKTDNQTVVACIAVFVGQIRLIDNIIL